MYYSTESITKKIFFQKIIKYNKYLSLLNKFLLYYLIENYILLLITYLGGFLMKILGEKSMSSLVKLLLDIIYIGGILILLSLPYSLNWYLSLSGYSVSIQIFYFLLGLLIVTGILALIIVNEIKKIFKTLKRKDPFISANVTSLKRMGISAFLISLFYVFKIIFFNSFMTVIIIMVFIIAGFFSIILAEVFSQAVAFKEDNDLTI